mmetsp:Transcript_58017/g.172568  ORF Transcript_58017/g.172568 Transcript_58017/m.172568 type:complete len:233 (-) Transcript_58017:398-1096(-)
MRGARSVVGCGVRQVGTGGSRGVTKGAAAVQHLPDALELLCAVILLIADDVPKNGHRPFQGGHTRCHARLVRGLRKGHRTPLTRQQLPQLSVRPLAHGSLVLECLLVAVVEGLAVRALLPHDVVQGGDVVLALLALLLDNLGQALQLLLAKTLLAADRFADAVLVHLSRVLLLRHTPLEVSVLHLHDVRVAIQAVPEILVSLLGEVPGGQVPDVVVQELNRLLALAVVQQLD